MLYRPRWLPKRVLLDHAAVMPVTGTVTVTVTLSAAVSRAGWRPCESSKGTPDCGSTRQTPHKLHIRFAPHCRWSQASR